jgi:hypothetical protein
MALQCPPAAGPCSFWCPPLARCDGTTGAAAPALISRPPERSSPSCLCPAGQCSCAGARIAGAGRHERADAPELRGLPLPHLRQSITLEDDYSFLNALLLCRALSGCATGHARKTKPALCEDPAWCIQHNDRVVCAAAAGSPEHSQVPELDAGPEVGLVHAFAFEQLHHPQRARHALQPVLVSCNCVAVHVMQMHRQLVLQMLLKR